MKNISKYITYQEATAKGFTSFVEPSKRNVGVAMARTRGVANKPSRGYSPAIYGCRIVGALFTGLWSLIKFIFKF